MSLIVHKNLYTSSRIMHLFCSDSVASPAQWLLNPDCSTRAPKVSGPHPTMRCQYSGENPGEKCGEHLNVLVAVLLSGKHLGGISKPSPTKNHLTQLFVGLRQLHMVLTVMYIHLASKSAWAEEAIRVGQVGAQGASFADQARPLVVIMWKHRPQIESKHWAGDCVTYTLT